MGVGTAGGRRDNFNRLRNPKIKAALSERWWKMQRRTS
jgi:hypothetical protein